MGRIRLIPALLLHQKGLVKTVQFKNPTYIGDPINAVKIFNDKEVDELIFLDISATEQKRKPDLELLKDIASECFMPLCYGGGICSMEDIKGVIKAGVEKIAFNTKAVLEPDFVKQASETFGSSTIVVSVDYRKNWLGKNLVTYNRGNSTIKMDPVSFSILMEEKGAGELLLNCIDRDGKMQGYDIETIKNISEKVSIPVIALGGAGSLKDISALIKQTNINAAAAGSLFVFQGKHRAVLINYPTPEEQEKEFNLPF